MNTISINNPTVSLGDLARGVSDVFRRAEHGPITVTRNSKPVARIIPYQAITRVAEDDYSDSKLLGYLTNAIAKEVTKKYKNKTIPSLAEQLADI